MNEIHIVCKKHDKHTSPIVNAGKLLAGGAAFIGIGSVVVSRTQSYSVVLESAL